MRNRFVITVTIKSNEEGSTPVDVTWYRGENHAEALAALVQAGAKDIGDESMPERMRAVVQAVRMDIYPLDPEPEPECSGRTGGRLSVPYCGRNEGGCPLHYPTEYASKQTAQAEPGATDSTVGEYTLYYTSADGPGDHSTWSVYSERYLDVDEETPIEGSSRWISRHPDEEAAATEAIRLQRGATDSTEQSSAPTLLENREGGCYYTGPLEPAQRLLIAEYGAENINLSWSMDEKVTVAEHRSGTPQDPNQWGTGDSKEEAWRYLLGADFGPIDEEYDESALIEALSRHGATDSTEQSNEQPEVSGNPEPVYGWQGWEEEADRANVYYLTITENGEEHAVIVHRICVDPQTGVAKFPLDGPIAQGKVKKAERIVEVLNGATGRD